MLKTKPEMKAGKRPQRLSVAASYVYSSPLGKLRRKKSVVVNGFAEAAPTRAKQGKDSHMISFSRRARKKMKKIRNPGDLTLDEHQVVSRMVIMIIEEIRRQIEKSTKSRYQISKDTGIDEAALCRIMQGGSCKVETADTLLKYFGLEVSKKSSIRRN
jgi:hypothetical protein